jgi:PAS domain S-box-containing protein
MLIFRYKRTILMFVIVLFLYFGIVVAVIVSHEQDMFDMYRKNTEGEIELVSAFIQDAIIRHDYASIEQFVVRWGRDHKDIIDLKIIAPNNFVIAHFKREPSIYAFSFKRLVTQSGRDYATIELIKDFYPVRKSLIRFILQLILGAILLTLMTGFTLWYSVRRLALIPLEREIAVRKEAEERFRTLMESAPDALLYVNAKGNIVMANIQAERLFGYPREELVGKELEKLIPERFRDIHKKHREEYFKAPTARSMGGHGYEPYGRAADGREFPVDISLSPVRTTEGIFVLADIRDVTGIKQAEQKIKRGYHFQKTISSILQISLENTPFEKQLEDILEEIISIPIIPSLKKGCIFLLEEDRPDVLKMKVQKGYPDNIDVCSIVPVGECLCGQAALSGEIIACDYDSELHKLKYEGIAPHSNYCIPVVKGGKTLGVISILLKKGYKRSKEDDEFMLSIANTVAGVIERHRMEQEKHKLQEQLIQAEKLSALGRLTANVAHEIRNPLTMIGGYAKRLSKTTTDERQKEYIDVIVSEVDRLEKILKSVLTYSRESSLDLKKHKIVEIVEESLKTFELISEERNIKIVRKFSDVSDIIIDGEKIKEVINNIVSNAVDFMPQGGILTVSILEEIIKDMPYLCIRIADTGVGIPSDKLRLVFEPFFTTKVMEKGTGLGLAISKKIVEDHGGFIKVESIVGKGSTFSIYIPYKDLK